MKKFLPVIAILSMVFSVLSCDLLENGIKLTDQSKVDSKLFKELTKYIDPEVAVYEINMNFADPFNSCATTAIVTYTDLGGTEPESRSVGLDSDWNQEWPVFFNLKKRTPDSGIKLGDIDLSVIPGYLQQGIDMMKDGDIVFTGIYDYRIKIDSANPADIIHEYELSSKAGTETKMKNGRMVTETGYYTYKFKVASDGIAEYIEE